MVQETEEDYYSKNSWDQCKHEDPDHRMVTTLTMLVRSDYISVDHNGRKMFHKFKDKTVENYKLRHFKLKDMFSRVDQYRFDIIFKDKLEEESQWLDNVSVDCKGEKGYCMLCEHCYVNTATEGQI